MAWRLALFGVGTGLFQSPNHSAVMGNAPRSHLGVASGILGTMRNVGMVFGVAAGGAVLFAFAPPGAFQKVSAPQGGLHRAGVRLHGRGGHGGAVGGHVPGGGEKARVGIPPGDRASSDLVAT